MPEEIACPSCEGRFAVKTFLRGMRVTCPHCQFAFGASMAAPAAAVAVAAAPEPVRDEYDIAEEEAIVPPPLPRATTATPIKPIKPAPIPYRSKQNAPKAEMTPGQKGALRLGISVFLFGLASLILPLFGLQFRKLQNAGENASIVSVILMAMGVVIAVMALLRWRLKMTLLIGGGSLAALVLLVVGLAVGPSLWRASGRGRIPSGPPSTPPQGWSPPSMPPPPGMPPSLPPGATSGPPITYDALVQRYGADQVVRIVVSGPDLRTVRDAVVFRNLRQAVRDAGAKTQTTRPDANGLICLAGPVSDLGAVAAALDLGPDPVIDRTARTITVQLTGPAKGSLHHVPTSRP